MRIELVAFESLGVRSQATFVETRDVRIFIDPAAALAPRRFSLPPHVREVERLRDLYREIERRLERSDVVVVTHYHYDHHDPGRFIDPELYQGKLFLVKDHRSRINFSQKMRAWRFLKILEGVGAEIRVADGAEVEFGGTLVRFSEPTHHGPDERLGYVIQVCVSDGRETLVFTSDVEGPVREEVVDFIRSCGPELVILDGPSTYLLGYRYPEEAFAKSIELMKAILDVESVRLLIADHHLLRELGYAERIAEVVSHARMLGKRVVSAADFMGVEPVLLEARRCELFEEEPVSGVDMLRSMRVDLRSLGE